MADRELRSAATVERSAGTAPNGESRDPAAAPHRSRLFALLVGACAVGAAAVLPYSLALLPPGQIQTTAPLPVLVAASVMQTSLLAAIAAACGLWLGPRVGLGAPMVRQSAAPLGRRLALAAVAGIGMGALLLALEALVFAPRLPTDISAEVGQRVAPWMGLLASVYGAVDEEVLLRLGVMTFLAWALSRPGGRHAGMSSSLMWVSIVGAALLFGAGHLPATAALAPLTPVVVARAILLNGLGGLLYGWLYWRQGLVLAMIAHGGTDLVLHVLAPIFLGRA